MHLRYELAKEIDVLPKGSLQFKKKNDHIYCYRAFRDDWGDVVYEYVRQEQIPALRDQIIKRKILQSEMRSVAEELHLVEKALGKRKINLSYIKEKVSAVIYG